MRSGEIANVPSIILGVFERRLRWCIRRCFGVTTICGLTNKFFCDNVLFVGSTSLSSPYLHNRFRELVWRCPLSTQFWRVLFRIWKTSMLQKRNSICTGIELQYYYPLSTDLYEIRLLGIPPGQSGGSSQLQHISCCHERCPLIMKPPFIYLGWTTPRADQFD